MIVGRSRQSYLLWAGRRLHVFVWGPWTNAESIGSTVRWRRANNDWQHVRLLALARNPRKRPGSNDRRHAKRAGRVLIRRTLTVFEVTTWRTRNGTSTRMGTKGYFRIKAAVPGKALS